MKTVLKLVAVSLLLACAPRLKLPSKGGPAWLELRSPRFLLRTDLEEPTARERLADLEAIADGLRLSWSQASPGGVTEVLAPATDEEADELFADAEARALGSASTGYFGGLQLVLSGAHPWGALPVIPRELAWQGLYHSLRRAPRWAAYGLTAYLETMVVDRAAGSVLFGAPHPEHGSELKRVGPAPAAWVLEWTHGRARRLVPGTSWLLVHQLISTRLEATREFLRRLGEGEEPDSARAAAFGPLAPAQLDGELAAVLQKGALDVVRLPLPKRPLEVLVRRLPEPELIGLWLEARAHSDAHFAASAIEREGREALAADATNPLAIAFSTPTAANRAGLAETALQQRPDDARLLLLLWAARLQLAADKAAHGTFPLHVSASWMLHDPLHGPGLDEPLDRAAVLLPDEPLVQVVHSLSLLARERPREALAPAERALRAWPAFLPALVAAGSALAAIGRCAEGRRLLQLARDHIADLEGPSGMVVYGHVYSSGWADLEGSLAQRLQRLGSCAPER